MAPEDVPEGGTFRRRPFRGAWLPPTAEKTVEIPPHQRIGNLLEPASAAAVHVLGEEGLGLGAGFDPIPKEG